jgi:hypothetical protein
VRRTQRAQRLAVSRCGLARVGVARLVELLAVEPRSSLAAGPRLARTAPECQRIGDTPLTPNQPLERLDACSSPSVPQFGHRGGCQRDLGEWW